ncbi:hypothetical protein MOQ_003875 [Trypanosoma cruzi marinkellei]|uniref:Uncharacterized protein n=1 Tax=Trypanosoma cruzi marinkellei TaxID=85056 RepID=K2NTI4_TRYCR|nr:hypothetical protein MOQ_003875 [Trypanosoma cruzi marinkellei]
MLRLTVSCFGLKRKNSPYVHKFLEGCPLPETLVDNLAGANLKSSTPFFSTMPRYIVAKENRLSTLFFHHALYPAGGARRPYHVVVVRGGRGVRNSPGVALSFSKTVSEEISCRLYKDPARRPFFYSRPTALTSSRFSHGVKNNNEGRNETSLNFGNMTGKERDMTATSSRSAEDNLLAPLCGVIENHFVALLKQHTIEEGGGKEMTANPTRAKGHTGKTIKEELTTLLSGGHGGIMTMKEEGDTMGSNFPCSDLVGKLLRDVASLPSSFFHIHVHLPSSAVFLTPDTTHKNTVAHEARVLVNKSEADRTGNSVVARLAGGLEPAVSFAVGSPLVVRGSAQCGNFVGYEGAVVDGMPFGHIQCLLRVCTRGRSDGGEELEEVVTKPNTCNEPIESLMYETDAFPVSTNDREGNTRENVNDCHGISSGILEPWKLGVSLDPKIPFYVRTMTEKQPAAVHTGNTVGDVVSSSTVCGCTLLGRSDCETYILPQRELLFSFYAPTEVVTMCAQQNEERMRRQAALGYNGPTHAFAEGPRTARRLLHGAHCNHVAAEEAAVAAASKRGTDCRGAPKNNFVVYEVRALPGDVVFVPRGWRYSVERIIGTAIINAAATTTPTEGMMTRKKTGSVGLPYGNIRTAFMHNKSSTLASSLGKVGTLSIKTKSQLRRIEAAEICGVEVEAFLLCYKPYPVLTAEQAAAYVPANYVRRGVEEFYAKGGNDVFHKYV